MRLKLSKQWVTYLLKLPESGMGYQKVDVTLTNGKVIKNLMVYNAEELEVLDNDKLFTIAEIKNITLAQNKVLMPIH